MKVVLLLALVACLMVVSFADGTNNVIGLTNTTPTTVSSTESKKVNDKSAGK